MDVSEFLAGRSGYDDKGSDTVPPSVPSVLRRCVKATLTELLEREMKPNDWLVDGLIHAGDQVVLAGPPKVGKSILGIQLALAIAEGSKPFLSPRFKTKSRPRSVLVFSLEMNEPMIGERLRKLFSEDKQRAVERAKKIPLEFIFRLDGECSLDVVDFDRNTESKAKKAGAATLSEHGRMLQQIVRELKPDLVVFDTLIRVHALDENNNVAMSHLLKFLREICSLDEMLPDPETQKLTRHRTQLAHVLIHHTRKEGNGPTSPANRDANAVRGAGAIHSEADLVLTLSEWDRDGVVMISMSARRVEVPDAMFLRRQGLEFREIDRPVGTREKNATRLADALWECFQAIPEGDPGLGTRQIAERVNELGYANLTEDNFRKTYLRKIVRFLVPKDPPKGDTDKVKRYRLRAKVEKQSFYTALNVKHAATNPQEAEDSGIQ